MAARRFLDAILPDVGAVEQIKGGASVFLTACRNRLRLSRFFPFSVGVHLAGLVEMITP